MLAFNYEAALAPSWNFSQELSKDQTTTYLKQKLVFHVIYAWVKPGRDIVLMVFSFLLHLLLLLLLLKTFLCSPVTQKLK